MIQALVALYERLVVSEDPARRLPEAGWQEREIAFLVDLHQDGTPVAFRSLRETQTTGRPRAPLLLVPQEVIRKGRIPRKPTLTDCSRASLFWDNPKYALGLPADDAAKSVQEAEICHGLFKLRHEQFAQVGAAEIRNDPGMLALLRFLDRCATSALSAIDANWMQAVREASGYVAFRLHEDLELICRRSLIRTAISAQATGARPAIVGQCLATGRSTRITRLHPFIHGVAGAPSTGASFVSFNASAFESYGLLQGENAPVGTYAAFAYTTALNRLLRHDSAYVARAGGTTVIFWAGEETANEAVLCNLMSSMVGQETRRAGVQMADVHATVRPGVPPPAEDRTLFFVLALSAESGRLTVRFFYQGTVAAAARNIVSWFDQSAIVPAEWPPLSLTSVLRGLSAQGDIGNLAPLIGSEVLRSAYTGTSLPHQAMAEAVLRSTAERGPTRARVALIKAFLIRNKGRMMTVALDPQEPDPAYRLGRLFAVLENLQTAALRLNITIRDRYWSTASCLPATTFPRLFDLGAVHLMKIKQDRIALALWFERQIGEITAVLPATFPPLLTLEEQGRFAVGYWHQRYARGPWGDSVEEAATTAVTGDTL